MRTGIVFILALCAVGGCRKASPGGGPSAALVSMIKTPRLWHHSIQLKLELLETSFSFNDTTFAIKVINPGSIAVGGDTLAYASSTDTSLFYSHVIDSSVGEQKSTSLSFYKNSNSLVYSINFYGGSGDSSHELFVSP